MPPMFMVSGEITETDRGFLNPKHQQEQVVKSEDIMINGLPVAVQSVRWRNSRDYKCAFCKADLAGKKSKCDCCGAYLIQFGNSDFMYKTKDKRRLGTGEEMRLRDEFTRRLAAVS